MRVEWLHRFERYYKMWTPIFGVRENLELALARRQEGKPDDAEIHIRIALYSHAHLLSELYRFVLEHGGLWILPDTQTGDQIADSSWYVRDPMPLSKIDESMLRMAFANNSELAVFMNAINVDRGLQVVLTKWRNWIHSCRCTRLNRPRRDCGLHASIRWLEFYMTKLDAQWDFLADWHDLPRTGSQVESSRKRKSTQPVLPPMDKRGQKI